MICVLKLFPFFKQMQPNPELSGLPRQPCLKTANQVRYVLHTQLHSSKASSSLSYPETQLEPRIQRMCLHYQRTLPFPKGPPWDSILVTLQNSSNYSLVPIICLRTCLLVNREGGESRLRCLCQLNIKNINMSEVIIVS